nr:4'-phosphopantetheinyl transferase superfamily protein [uncultured Enterobacter sp.]
MLTVTHTLTRPPFITHAQSGIVAPQPALAFCLARYDKRHYHDALFAQAGLPFPPALAQAVDKRKAEYFAARFCAQQLLRQLGDNDVVGSHPDRAPQWPAGVYGSLSHSGDLAIAVVARQSSGLRPGVDIEHMNADVMRETAEMFTTPAEQVLLARTDLAREQALLITFSAKESLFKALYPQVQQMFDFDSACIIELNSAQQRFRLRLTRSLAVKLPQGSEFTGFYQHIDDAVVTCVF